MEEEVEENDNQQLAQVLHYFTSRTDLELSVEKGDIVIFLEKEGNIWSFCQYRGEIGYIPSNYIKLIDQIPEDEPEESSEEEDIEELLLKDKKIAPKLPAPKIPPPPSAKEKEKKRNELLDELALRGSGLQLNDQGKLKKVKENENIQTLEQHKDVVAVALFDFTGTQNNELTFKKGDQIIVYSKNQGGWWQGSRDGTIGYFPCDYVILLDGETPIEIITSIGPQNSINSEGIKKDFIEIEDQIKKRILEQHNEMEQARKKLDWYQPGTKEYQEIFMILEEHRVLHDSLLQNLKNHQQLCDKKNEKLKEKSIVDQVKEKIYEQKEEMRKINIELKNCIPADRKKLQNQLEEHEILLSALYENLESLAMYRLQEEEIQKQQQEVEMISVLSKKVAAQVLKVEQCRQALVNCSGSYEETRSAKLNIEENVMLLEALQANLRALTSNSEQPNINDVQIQEKRPRGSIIMKSFRKSKKQPASPQRKSNLAKSHVHQSRAASSFFLPTLSDGPQERKNSGPRESVIPSNINQPLPQIKSTSAPVIKEPIITAEPVVNLSPQHKKREKKVAHSTQALDDSVSGNKKQKRRGKYLKKISSFKKISKNIFFFFLFYISSC